jgi:transcription-repair coupling factor (superfamily II helicase)
MLSSEARKRLQAVTQFSDLGSGMNIAMRDLDIRGAGNLLGGEQSGFINDLGFETYQKILDEAVQELKENEFKELYHEQASKTGEFVADCVLETDLEILIPDDYIIDIAERLSIYRELDNLSTEIELEEYKAKLEDRFGDLPRQTQDLFDALRLRRMAKEIGFEKLTIKSEKLIGNFVSRPDSPYFQSSAFTYVLDFIKNNPHGYKMYEKGNGLRLSKFGVTSISSAIQALVPMHYENQVISAD